MRPSHLVHHDHRLEVPVRSRSHLAEQVAAAAVGVAVVVRLYPSQQLVVPHLYRHPVRADYLLDPVQNQRDLAGFVQG